MRALKIIVSLLLAIGVSSGVFYLQVLYPVQKEEPATPVQPSSLPASDEPVELSGADAEREALLNATSTITHIMLLSGMGVGFTPAPEEIQQFLEASDREHVPVENIGFISAPYVRGSSLLSGERLNPENAVTFRWDANDRHTKVTPRSVTNGMIASIALAASYSYAPPENNMAFDAVVLVREASEGMRFLEDQMKLDSGLYAASWQGGRIVNAVPLIEDQGSVLSAYLRLAAYAEDYTTHYVSDISAGQVRAAADALVKNIASYLGDDESRITAASQRSLARLLAVLSLYSEETHNEEIGNDARSLAGRIAGALKISVHTEPKHSVESAAENFTGFALAYRALKDSTLRVAALDAWQELESYWDETHSFYFADRDANVSIITPEAIASILRAYNAVPYINAREEGIDTAQSAVSETGSGAEATHSQSLAASISGQHLVERVRIIINRVIRQSGILPSEDYGAERIDPEDDLPPVSDIRKAPVFVARVALMRKSHRWQVIDASVDTAEALSLAAELIQLTLRWDVRFGTAAPEPWCATSCASSD